MISSNLVVEGVPGNHHLHHHALAAAGSHHPIHSFGAIHHLNPSTVVTSRAHLMSATTFAEPSSFLKTPNGSLMPSAEFLRPLPKPAPVVATRYNGVTSSLNGSIKSRLAGKYADGDLQQGPVNLVHQLKDSAADAHTNYGGLYAAPRLYPPGPSYPPHFPPPPSIQSGPYGPLYPSSPFTPMLQRENRSTHLLQLQQYPDSNTPILKSPPTSMVGSSIASSVKTIYESPVVPIVASEPSNHRGEKRPFKVPSGKEGSMKHRILTRPEARVPKKGTRCVSALLPPPVPPPTVTATTPVSSTSNGVVATSPTEASTPTVLANGQNGATLHNFSRGSLIQLANGVLKPVEDMQTEDFLTSAEKSETVRIDPSTVVRIQANPINKEVATLTLSYGEQRHQVDFETALERPYFVFEHGWSSCAPDRTLLKYGLQCRQLQLGDVCVSLTPRLGRGVASRKSSSLKTDNGVRKSCQQQQQQQQQPALPLQNGHHHQPLPQRQQHQLTSNVDAKASAHKKNDLRINSSDSDEPRASNGARCNGNAVVTGGGGCVDSSNPNNCSFSANVVANRRDEARIKFEKLENDSNNNSNDTSDKYDGVSSKKKRRWSAPDQITEEYQSSPLSSPLSSSSAMSSASSVCSAVVSTKNL